MGRLRGASTGSPGVPAWSMRSRSARRLITSETSTRSSTRCSTSSRCTGSTISLARKPPRTCTCCGSPTSRRPRSGTVGTSNRCRSTCRRRSVSATGPSSTTPRARCSTCWSPTCSRWPPSFSLAGDGDVRLIHDVLLGDRSLFTRPDGLAAVWEVAEPLLSRPPQVSSYAPGSWGPARAREPVAPGRWLAGQ